MEVVEPRGAAGACRAGRDQREDVGPALRRVEDRERLAGLAIRSEKREPVIPDGDRRVEARHHAPLVRQNERATVGRHFDVVMGADAAVPEDAAVAIHPQHVAVLVEEDGSGHAGPDFPLYRPDGEYAAVGQELGPRPPLAGRVLPSLHDLAIERHQLGATEGTHRDEAVAGTRTLDVELHDSRGITLPPPAG